MAKLKHSAGYNWAKRNLLTSGDAHIAWRLQEKLEQSQWIGLDQHQVIQNQLISALLSHAEKHVPYYQNRLPKIDPSKPLAEEIWRNLPIVTRGDLQSEGDAFNASFVPSSHGRVTKTTTSGSTAQPITVLHTDISSNWHRALTLRSQLWALKRFDRQLGVIRRYGKGTADYPDGFFSDRWADDLTLPFATGSVAGLSVATALSEQVEWLLRVKPQVLVTFPSNLDALCRFALNHEIKLPQLKRVLTLGEALPEGVRDLARQVLGARVADTYSAAEVGEIAIQCPQNDAYHVQAESVVVEILDNDGRPCEPGETGRVVLTALHNYATPLIRYAIGDLATVGAPCRCGRRLPILSNVLGRYRNMMVAADGSQFWPSFGLKSYQEIAPVSQGQYIQHSLDDLEVILVAGRPLSNDEEMAIRSIILSRMPSPIGVRFTYKDELKRGDSGKFEEFICRFELGS